jgi:[glutamine synthetase] adenylyltransferase / [glutamine synthetase]-adenylyl-L-tyrosine phosphorylase
VVTSEPVPPAIDLSAAANPDWAGGAVARMSPDVLPSDADAQRRLAVLLGASEAFGDLLVNRPELLAVVDDDPAPWTAADVAARAVGCTDDPGQLAKLQREGLLRVAVRDLLGLADTAVAAGELADLADGLLQAALDEVARRPEVGDAELCVLAMGKLGGQELNYVSDIDVLFVHRGDATAAERMARAFMHLTGGHTPYGHVYEMDANLRPEGRNGPLSRSLESYESYYDRWASTWEFQALLKMRPVAGPTDLSDAYVALVDPYVWPDARGAEAVAEIQQMKGRVERSKPVVRDGERQLKLAPGGLRDIEFATQLLQLVHGPADPSLRARGTVDALAALARGGYVDDGDANLFTDSYLFLRTVEHRLQLRHLRRTHTVPAEAGDRQRLARSFGFRDLPVRSAREQFDAEIARVRGGVRRLHQQLFFRPLLGTLASYGLDDRVPESRGLDVDAAAERLRVLGFNAASQALDHLEAMVRGTGRTSRQLRVVLPGMLEALSETPDPDAGLTALRALSDELRDNPRFIRTIRENPASAQMLAQVLGRSPRLGDWFGRQPEVLRLFDEADALRRPRTREELHAGAAGLVRRGGGATSGDALRRYKRREALRTALRNATDEADLVQVGRELTWLSEGLLQAALASVDQAGEGEEARVAIIAMGRFGAAELSHGSDLDILFVHDGDTARAGKVAAAVVELLSGITPEGSAFRIDTALRPEGRHGPLTRSLESYAAYYDRWGQFWELQALTQARPVAGDAAVGAAFMDLITPRVYTDPVDPAMLMAIRQMKARVEAERAPRPTPAGPRPPRRAGARRGAAPVQRGQTRPGRSIEPGANLKLGPGGLSDVEWTVQLLRLAHGGARPEVQGHGTLDGLVALQDAGLLSAEEAAWMRAGWILLSRVRNSLWLIGERDTSTMPTQPDRLRKLADSMHHESDQALVEEVERARRRIRKVFDRRFF